MQIKNFFLSLFLGLLVLASCTKQEDIEDVEEIPDNPQTDQPVESVFYGAALNDQYIVVLKNDAAISNLDVKGKKENVQGKAKGLLKKYEITGTVEDVYETVFEGFVAKLSPGQLAKLEEDSLVRYVEQDQLIYIAARKTKPAPAPTPSPVPDPTPTPTPTTGQSIPWGVTRVGGGATYTGTGVAWVIDSGIYLTHPDLNVDKVRGRSFVTGVTSPNDDYGHGTHVAGTIAGINNTVGVTGVAAGATVVPVKVLDGTGYGTFSSILAGINYVAANGKAGDVVNMSMGGGVSPTIDEAVKSASAVLKFAIAAGNESDYAYNHSPARVNGLNVYTVTAMSSGDNWASFSNFGNTVVDYCAPGVSVLSTTKGGGYGSMTGTSMAAPHVAGLLLLGSIRTDGTVANDPDGTADPIAHR